MTTLTYTDQRSSAPLAPAQRAPVQRAPVQKSPVQRGSDTGEGRFAIFAIVLSVVLAVLGYAAAERPQPDAATGDPFLFVLRP